MTTRIPALDAVKAWAILCVIVGHASLFPSFPLIGAGFEMPLFMVVFGVTHALTRWDFRPKKYIGDILRVAVVTLPVAVLFYVSGKFMVDCPGDYFVAVLFGSMLAFPVIMAAYRKEPEITLALALLVNLMVDLASPMIPYYIYRILFLRYLFAIVLGVYIGDRIRSGNYDIPAWLTAAGIGAAVLLVTGAYAVLPFRPEWLSHNSFTYAYAALVVCIALTVLVPDWMGVVGRYTYEIFLVQMIVFAGIIGVVVSWVMVPVIVAAGVAYGVVMRRVLGMVGKV